MSMKFKYRLISLVILFSWLGTIILLALDARGLFGSDIGLENTLATSSFARGMFIDIGALSTLAAIWIIFATKYWFRFLFAFASLFIGSFAVMPFLAIHFWIISRQK